MDESLEKTLQGDRWMGHPLHPALVALPIGMWCLGATLDFVSLFSKNECIQEAADNAVTAGLVGAGMSAVSGLGEFMRVPQNEEARQMALTHAAVNVSAVAISSVNAIVRNGRRGAGKPGGMFPKLLSWATMGLISYSGWLGGNLVFNFGTAVDTQRRHELREKAKIEEKREPRVKPSRREREEEARTHA